MRWFALFMMSLGLPILFIASLSEGEAGWYICNFVEWLAGGGRAYSTVKGHVSGVRYLFVSVGLPSPTNTPRVQYMMRSLKKALKGSIPKKIITVSMLEKFAGFFPSLRLSSADGMFQRAVFATMVLAMHALLRGSEYAWKGTQATWTAAEGLARQDVSFVFAADDTAKATPIAMKVKIKGSKTDVLRHGATFTFYATANALCVVAAVWAAYCDGGALGFNPTGPLFRGRDGVHALPYSAVTTAVKFCIGRIAGLDPKDYGTHSFRSGGATALMAAGYDIAYIKMMGRWSSSCFERYLRLDISAVQDMARAMQTGHRERAPFFFDSLVTAGTAELLRLS